MMTERKNTYYEKVCEMIKHKQIKKGKIVDE
jgi:hypothetical protein